MVISCYDLQQFVHYTLPRKYLAGVEEHIAVVRALGEALERLGVPAEYVDLCRSPETIALLRLWAVDEDAAFAQFAAFTDASGLEPPDVEELQWQGVMGLAEARTREAATLALERALEAGDTRPAAEIVRAVLADPDPDGEHPAVNPRLHLLMHTVVGDRLLHDEPPEDWLVFDARLARGVDTHEVVLSLPGLRSTARLDGRAGRSAAPGSPRPLAGSRPSA